ncbi:MAG: RNA polymerase sigma factor [Gemmatimonadota bacterium]
MDRRERDRHRAKGDDELVRAAREGDREAFDRLVERHARTAVVLALARVGDPDVAEDVAQDALVRAWTTLHACRDPARFGAWLRTIVHRTALNRRERRERRKRIFGRFQAEAAGASSGAGPAPDGWLERAGPRQELTNALEGLGSRQREVLLLHDLEGRTHREISGILGIGPGTSRKYLSEARARLRETLEEEGITHERV